MAQDTSSNNRWHSIRPWTPRLSLSVRELTSVSATFILSSLSAHTNLSLILDGDDAHSDDENDDDASPSPSGGAEPQPIVIASGSGSGSRSQRIISDALSKGLSVTVNGAPWQWVLIRVDDEADEAVIIIYRLMPGRQYDIELGIIPGEERVKGQIMTDSRRAFLCCEDNSGLLTGLFMKFTSYTFGRRHQRRSCRPPPHLSFPPDLFAFPAVFTNTLILCRSPTAPPHTTVRSSNR